MEYKVNFSIKNSKYAMHTENIRKMGIIDNIILHVLPMHDPSARNCAKHLQDRDPLYHYVVDCYEIFQLVPDAYRIDHPSVAYLNNMTAIHIAVLCYEGQAWTFQTICRLLAVMRYRGGIESTYILSNTLVETYMVELLMEEVRELVKEMSKEWSDFI